jgi:hypothetical protein
VVADARDLRGEPAGDRGGRAVVHLGHEDPRCPYQVMQWRREHPGEDISPTGTSSSSPWPAVVAAFRARRARPERVQHSYPVRRW